MKRFCFAAAALAVSSVLAFAQQADFDAVEIKAEKVKGGIYMLTGQGGNMGLSVGQDSTFLIDDQYAPLSGKIEAAIAEIADSPVEFLINTHWHGDHTGGNEAFGSAGAVIVAHDNVRKRLNEGLVSRLRNTTIEPAPGAALPVITFSEDVSFHLNGEEIHIFHIANAHTDGDAVVHFKTSNVLHTGDLFFNGLYPFIDPESGGHIDGMIAAQQQLLDLIDDDTRIIPGHGPLATKADLAAARDLLIEIRRRIQAEIDAGKSMAQVVADRPLADLDETYAPPGSFLSGDLLTRLAYMMLAPQQQ